jgi:hypothetical protein
MALSRRGFLVGGAAALGAAALPSTRAAQADTARPGRNLIVVLAYGGWDVTYALDPKPGVPGIDAPSGAVQLFGDLPIFTDPSRPLVTSFFAAYAPLCAVVNGIQVQSIVHPDCTKRILTGTASDANPDLGAIAAYELGRDLPAPYLVLGPTAYTGPLASIAARAGTVNQIRTLLSPNAAFPTGVPRFVPDAEEEALIRQVVEARAAREQAIRGQHGYNRARFEDFREALVRGDVLKQFSGGFGEDFTFTLGLPEQIMLGLDAIQGGVCHSLHLEQAFAQWDTHQANAQQAALHDALFDGLRLLGDELAARPGKAPGAKMIDETVVAVVSEMSRTPKLNAAQGKDHWPVTSALIFGGGVAGGRAYGKSGDGLEALSVDFASGQPDAGGKQLQYGNLVAGLLELVGVDPSSYLPNSEPFRAPLA